MGLLLKMCDEVPTTVKPDATVADAVKKMIENRVGAVGVVDDVGRVAGIFTERDVLKKLVLSGKDPSKTKVLELMTSAVALATEETSPGEALEVMVDRHIRHLPIVDNGGKLLGMLSIRNLLQHQADDLRQQLDSLEQYVSNDGPGG